MLERLETIILTKTNKMTTKKLIEKVNDYFDTDIKKDSNLREVVLPRKIFFVIGKELGFSLSSLGRAAKRSHSMVWVANEKHEDEMIYNKLYKDSYNSFYSNLFVKEEKKEVEVPNSIIEISGFNELLKLNDSQLLEFSETRLKPFLAMLESRKQYERPQKKEIL